MSDGGYWDRQIGTWLPNDPKCYCDKCGNEVEEDELNEVWFEEYVCDDCYVDYIKCDHCGHEVYVDDTEIVGIENICEDCYDEFVRECAICGKEYLNEDEDVLICNKCFKDLPDK